MSLRNHYTSLLKKSGELQDEMLSDCDAAAAFTVIHNAATDIEKLISVIEDRPESQLMKLALREHQFALMAASFGHYRHAYISTRLFMELMLGAIYFSAFEIYLRKWMKNSQDIVWGAIIDKEHGPLSKSFITAFSPDFASHGIQYHAIAEAVYRECSEYVHGNLNTHSNVDQPLQYNRDQLISWTEKMKSALLTVTFAFTARYASFLTKSQLDFIEPVILEEFGDNVAVQTLFAK